MIRSTLFDSGWEFAAQSWLLDEDAPRKLGYAELSWLPARVPGHVHQDLVRHGIIADPHRARFELGAQWVDEERWVFRKSFRFTSDSRWRHRILRFEGLDTVCRVLLNGAQVAVHDNMHVPLEVDVSARLREGDNQLRIEFESAPAVGRTRRRQFLESEGLPDNVVRFDERAFLRKAQYMFAWDWGPRLCSAGVWKPVTLLEFTARITDVYVQQEHQRDGSVRLTLRTEVEGGGRVLHRMQGVEGWIEDGQSVTLREPRLWWPAGWGEQALYEVRSYLFAGGEQAPSADQGAAPRAKAIRDQRSTRIGLRTIRLLRERDAQGESFEFEVNGRKIWCMGANWIPDHSFPALVDRTRLHSRLCQARDMNMNMLRVWGGGLYESDEFYDLCDELGILVWQDFPFACSYVPDGEAEQAAMEREGEVNIRRLRNHPSLALWCGNNENLTMWHSKWESPKPQPSRYYGERIYDQTLPRLVERWDPATGYVASSPIGGENANDGDVGDQHYWDVWHGRGDWKHYKDSTGRFASEFGFASSPCDSVWRQVYGEGIDWSSRPVRDPIARWHDKTAKGYDTYVGYTELHYPVARDLGEFVYTSQLNQRDALRFGVEHFRRSFGCRGSLIWQLNDCWPVQSWAVVDFHGNYKAAAFELRRLYRPLLLSLEHEAGQQEGRLWVLSHNMDRAIRGELTVRVRSSSDGTVLRDWTTQLEVAPDSSVCALELDLSHLPLSEVLLEARLLPSRDEASSVACSGDEGAATVRLLAEPKQMVLPSPTLQLAVRDQELVLYSDRPVVDLMLWDASDGAVLLDNFITLARAGEHRIRVRGRPGELRARSLAGLHPIQS